VDRPGDAEQRSRDPRRVVGIEDGDVSTQAAPGSPFETVRVAVVRIDETYRGAKG
jgi:hypothetical protein